MIKESNKKISGNRTQTTPGLRGGKQNSNGREHSAGETENRALDRKSAEGRDCSRVGGTPEMLRRPRRCGFCRENAAKRRRQRWRKN